MLQQLYPSEALYNYAQHYTITGPLNDEAFEKSLQYVAQRHEILRSNYREENGALVQFVAREEIPVDNWLRENDAHAEQLQAFSRQDFELENDPLFRAYRLIDEEHTVELLLVMHHIVGDAQSLQIINREVAEAYQALANG